jgi:hypothetical protein
MISTFTMGTRHSEHANTVCGKPTATGQNATLSSDENSFGDSWPNNTVLQPHDEVLIETKKAQD